jgi:hypothetical protein
MSEFIISVRRSFEQYGIIFQRFETVGLLDRDVKELRRAVHNTAYLHLALRLGMNGSTYVLPIHDHDLYRGSITFYFLLVIILTYFLHIVGVEGYCCP